MLGRKGKWSWSQRLSNSHVIAVMLIRPGNSIAITFPRPAGWTGERKEDRDFVRAMLFSAAEEQWCKAPSAP
jgi:hypothetical protein